MEKILENVDFDYLSEGINREKLEKFELDTIESNPDLAAFYKSLRWQLNSLYLASASIATGMLENQKTGVTGKVGGLIEKASSHVPFIGIGIALVGEVMSEIDKKGWDGKIENYIELAVDSSEMAQLAEQLARKLALTIDLKQVQKDNIAKGASFIERADELVGSGDTSLASNIASAYLMVKDRYSSAKGSSEIGEFASKFVMGVEQADSPGSMGEDKAVIIAKLLTRMIYADQIDLSGNMEIKLAALLSSVPQEWSEKSVVPEQEYAPAPEYYESKEDLVSDEKTKLISSPASKKEYKELATSIYDKCMDRFDGKLVAREIEKEDFIGNLSKALQTANISTVNIQDAEFRSEAVRNISEQLASKESNLFERQSGSFCCGGSSVGINSEVISNQELFTDKVSAVFAGDSNLSPLEIE